MVIAFALSFDSLQVDWFGDPGAVLLGLSCIFIQIPGIVASVAVICSIFLHIFSNLTYCTIRRCSLLIKHDLGFRYQDDPALG